MKIDYRILDFEQVNEKLDRLKEQESSLKIIEQSPLCITRLGYTVRHFTAGYGNKHILIIGGTHGSEIISVDFVLRLMNSISKKEDGFENFDESDVTIDFIPLHNPEGYIISSSAIKTLIKDSMSDSEKEKICKEYYVKYREDDIYAKSNPDDHSSLKQHQEMFKHADYTCISPTHSKLRESVHQIQEKYPSQSGSMICWRANGSGVELNRNHPFCDSTIGYGQLRYNNLKKNIPGPLGTLSFGNEFSFEPENKSLLSFIDNLYNSNKYCGIISYHSTMGMLYVNPSYEADESILSDEDRYMFTSINNYLANIYCSKAGYGIIEDPDFNATDELLRVIYPATILVELSKMGGNPIGPYGDITNYERVMNDNMIASSHVIRELPKMQDFLYKKSILVDKVEPKKK